MYSHLNCIIHKPGTIPLSTVQDAKHYVTHLVNNKWIKSLSEAKLRKIKAALVQPVCITQRKGQAIVCASGQHHQKRNTAPANQLAAEYTERSIFILYGEKATYTCSFQNKLFTIKLLINIYKYYECCLSYSSYKILAETKSNSAI